MRRHWLLNQHGVDGASSEGPTALIETDSAMRVVDVLRFGPGITELEDQQRIWDAIAGKVARGLKPIVPAKDIDVEGVLPDEGLQRSKTVGGRAGRRAGQAATKGAGSAATAKGPTGPSRKGGRGDR